MINPKIAPQLPIEQQRAPISPAVASDVLAERYSPRMLWALYQGACWRRANPAKASSGCSWRMNLLRALVPVWLALVLPGHDLVVRGHLHAEGRGRPRLQSATQKAGSACAHSPAAWQEPPSPSGGLAEPPGAIDGGLAGAAGIKLRAAGTTGRA